MATGRDGRLLAWVVVLAAAAAITVATEWPRVALGLFFGIVIIALVSYPQRTRRHQQRTEEEARQRRQQAKRQAELDRQIATADGMTGPEFERLVGRLLERDGCTDIRVTGGPGDLGADVVAIGPTGGLVVVQCKRYSAQPVGSADVQRFFGGVQQDPREINAAVMVTTSRFTAPARQLAERVRIQLVDRAALARWMADGADWRFKT